MTPVLQRFSALLCLPLAGAAIYFHAGDDLWNDEIYTLQQFVFKGLGTVVSDYHVPNNHILANIFHWLWIKMTFMGSLGDLLDHPWRMRLLPLLFSVATLGLVFRAGLQIGGRTAAWLAVILLLSGVTFQAYAFQVRGYALSMTASAAVAALLLQWAAGKPLNRWQQAGLALAAAALLYALPSNLYFLGAVVGSAGIAQAIFFRSEGIKPALLPAGLLAGGAALAFIAYQPVIGQMQGSEYFASGAAFQSEHFRKFGLVMSHFFSRRWLLLPVAIAGVYFGWQKGGAARKQIGWLVPVLVLPFLFSALRGDLPPERIYLTLLPVFALTLAAAVYHAFEKISPTRKGIAYGALLVYCVLAYTYGVYQVRRFLRNSLEQADHYYPGLNHNYYQHYYDPNAEYDLFRKKFGTDKVLILESSEAHDMPVYLQHKKQAFVPLDSIGSYLQRRQTMYVSSAYSKAFMQEMAKMGPAWSCRYLQPKARIPRIIVCEPAGR